MGVVKSLASIANDMGNFSNSLSKKNTNRMSEGAHITSNRRFQSEDQMMGAEINSVLSLSMTARGELKKNIIFLEGHTEP